MKNTISYFNIDWMSCYDGPGNRVAIFLQGCNLQCKWCHSPHSQPKISPLLFNEHLCIACAKCVDACQQKLHSFVGSKHLIDRSTCTFCGACIEACPVSSRNGREMGSLSLPSTEISPLDLFHKIEPQLNLLKNIGGLTLSGGEALLQSQALLPFVDLCKENSHHIALETSGTIPLQNKKDLLPKIDKWLFGARLSTDFNGIDEKLYGTVRQNLKLLKKYKADICIRYPVIPRVTTTKEYLDRTNALMQEFNVREIDILPYNPDTSHYYRCIGQELPIEFTSEEISNSHKMIKDFFN